MPRAFIGLGSNLGDREANLAAALDALGRVAGVRLARVSSLIESEPEGCPPGSGRFLNGVAAIETSLGPRELLAALLEIERGLGRDRAGRPRNAPRTLDLDLLLYADAVVSGPGLELPHPRMHQRAFVLWPLLQIEPRAIDPRSGEPWAAALARLRDGAPGAAGL
ncbi:MAG: 2-amino-4-hydroxy-6-hydroxymethyldihydropteridine diphosphokinase [Planctomycetes bacterium]|jgi:2-amino-4-hydroxy-6-hydroxymethyldihydropteridine diphosphokinase|nr:2-amino-4-hydroxy-6-hydroxymethyldihydropteridine diphosphokinase [Planctomycetota bacterium]MCL4730609.1 2-amino-4-hydroxy-6-hydroxymethyldihydropteridine diphosphokinase [Planctomycetota bacterium]